jgi:hypothetical protein
MTQPSVPTVYINQRVDDPLIAAIAGRAVAELTLAAHKAAAHIASPEVFAVEADHHEEQLFLKLLNGLAVEKRTQIAGKGLAFMRLDEAARAAVIGSLAGADVRNGISVETAARSIALDFPKAAAMRPVPSGGVRTPASQNTGDMHTRDAPSSTTQPLEILEFRLLRIRCNDETDGAGDDDIAVSAVLTDPNMKVTKSQVGDLGEFEEGRDWTLPTPICFGSFDMKAGVAWPRRYSAVVFITELDWGGFPAWLDELVVSIKTKLKDLVEKAVAKFLEELGPVGEWLGKAAAWLVGEVFGGIIDLIKDWVDDDILDPIKFDVEFPAADARWLGQPDSTAFAVEGGAGGHGGGYHVWCEWRLTTRGAAQTPPQLVTGPLEDIATDLNGVACLHGGAEVTAVGVPAVFALRADRCVWTCEPAAAMESQWRSLGGALRSGARRGRRRGWSPHGVCARGRRCGLVPAARRRMD